LIRKKLPAVSTTRNKTTQNDQPIGRIAGLFGIKGELKCDPTSSGRSLFVEGARLRCDDKIVTIESVREHKGRLLITLEEAQDATAAEAFIGATFFAPRENLEVEEGEYLDIDLVGCTVRSKDRDYGKVGRVDHYPASDMLILGGRMLPMVGAFIKSIDVKKKEILVEIPPGLLDDDSETA